MLLGVVLEATRREDLRFLPSMNIRSLGPALINALERLGGIPEAVRLPLIPPFCRMVEDGPPALHPEIDGLSHAFHVLFVFPALYEVPVPLWGRSLEISFHQIVNEFLPGRSPESLAVRNRALEDWVQQRQTCRGPRHARHRDTRERRKS